MDSQNRSSPEMLYVQHNSNYPHRIQRGACIRPHKVGKQLKLNIQNDKQNIRSAPRDERDYNTWC